ILYYAIAVLAVATAVAAGMAGGQVFAGCAVRIAVSLRGAARRGAWRRRPGPVCNRPLHSGFPLLFHSPAPFTHLRTSGRTAACACCDCGTVRGLAQRGAKTHGGIAAARARRAEGDSSRAGNTQHIAENGERRTHPGGTNRAPSRTRTSGNDRHHSGNCRQVSAGWITRFFLLELAHLYRSLPGQPTRTPLGSCNSS